MKQHKITLLFLISLLAVGGINGCEGRDRPGRQEKGNSAKVIIPQSKLDSVLAGSLGDAESNLLDSALEEQEPKIVLSENETFIQLLNINLDLDGSAEQIIAVKDNRDPDNLIKIGVVDFDEIRNDYYLAWQDYVQATNPTALRIETEDMTGDFSTEIVCRGMNTAGELTLDIFRKTASQSGLGLAFYSILQLKASNKVSIEKEKRDEAYLLRQAPGTSFPVVVERNDPESESGFDLLKETYYWSYQEKKYIKTASEKIPSNQVAQTQLKELFSQDAPDEEYLSFFKGIWYLQHQADTMVVFSPEENCISFFNKNIIENYAISNLYRFGYRFHFNTESTVIQSIKKWIEVNVRSLNAIEINIRDGESWNGSYERIAESVGLQFLAQNRPTAEPNKIVLSGVYKNREGLEIVFEHTPPYFTWLENGESQGSGGYSITHNILMLNALFLEREISKNVAVIVFRFQKENGLLIKDSCYILEFTEKLENNTRNRMLTLTPGRLLIKGVEAVERRSLQLEQTEIVGPEKTDSNSKSGKK